MGIFFALIALVSWGMGDFLIQRSARKRGDVATLFFIEAVGAVGLLPFVAKDLLQLLTKPAHLLLLVVAGFVVLGAALIDFEALRIGKLSVIEPINAIEIMVTMGLAALIIGESPNAWQFVLLATLIVGLLLVSVKSLKSLRSLRMERGVSYAILAMLGMGTVNFLFGIGARFTNPLLINWFTAVIPAAFCLLFLARRSALHSVRDDWKHDWRLILATSVIDNAAWIAFAYSTLFIPIAIATGISESYIALAAILGLIYNKEKLARHQFVGLAVSVVAVIMLSVITH